MYGDETQQVNSKMLKVVRTRLKLNQEKFGKRLGVHRPDISKIERGLETPDWLIKFAQMAKLLHEAGMSWEDVVMEFPEAAPATSVRESAAKYTVD